MLSPIGLGGYGTNAVYFVPPENPETLEVHVIAKPNRTGRTSRRRQAAPPLEREVCCRVSRHEAGHPRALKLFGAFLLRRAGGRRRHRPRLHAARMGAPAWLHRHGLDRGAV